MIKYAFVVYAACLVLFFILLRYLKLPSRILMSLVFSLIVITLILKPHPMGIVKNDKNSIGYYVILMGTISYIVIYAIYYSMTDNLYCIV